MKTKRKKYAAGTAKVNTAGSGNTSGDTIGALAAGTGMLLQALKPAPKKQDGTVAPPGETAVEIAEGGSAMDVASSAASGAAMGASVGGPWGALVGGVVGAGAGVVNYSAAEKAHEESLKKRNLQVQRYNRSNINTDTNSLAQVGQYKGGVKKLAKPSQAASQDATAPANMYRSSPSDGKGGTAQLKKTTKAATAILGLAKAIPTPVTQAIGWGASGISAGIGVNDGIQDVQKGDYGSAALNFGGAALDLVPLNVSKAGKVGKTIDLLKKGSKARNVRSATNAGVRAAQAAAIANDEEDVRGSYKAGTKAIEIEGKEPLFSKKVNGKRTLKLYAHNGPTHEEGGIPVLAQEGDAVITAKNNLGPAAVAAHAAGDHETVEKIINQMPADKGQGKASKGKRKVVPTRKRDPNVDSVTGRPLIKSTPWDGSTFERNGAGAMGMQQGLNAAGYKLDVDGKPGAQTQAAYNDFKGLNAPLLNQQQIQAQAPAIPKKLAPLDTTKLPVTSPAVKGNTVKQRSAGQNAALKVAEAAPTLFNLTQGLFGETEKTARRGYSPILQNYEDLSGSQRTASRVAKNMQVANARNVSGGSAGNIRANTNQAFADDVARQNQIDQQEVGRRMGITASNNELTSKAQLINNQMNDNADNLDLQNAAKKQEALSRGLEGISGLASNSILTDNKLAKEEADRNLLGQAYRTMTTDADGNIILRKKPTDKLPTNRKGLKSLKMKKNC
jgi:hypothetical protein